MTNRISVTRSDTNFLIEADTTEQNIIGNYSIVKMYMTAINRGNTSTKTLKSGIQHMSVDGVWVGVGHSGDPFLPDGVATNANRWRMGPYYIRVAHKADGTRGPVTFRMTLNYFGVKQTYLYSYTDFPKINASTTSILLAKAWVLYNKVWVKAIPYVRDKGAWKLAEPWVKVDGTWVKL